MGFECYHRHQTQVHFDLARTGGDWRDVPIEVSTEEFGRWVKLEAMIRASLVEVDLASKAEVV